MSDAHSSTPAGRGAADKAGPDGGHNEKIIEIKAIATRPASGEANRAADAGMIVIGETRAGRAQARRTLIDRLTTRAATIAIAAGLGAAAGALVSNGIGYTAAMASLEADAPDPAEALRASVSQLAAELAALKETVAANGGHTGAATTPTRTVSLSAGKNPVSREITGSVEPVPARPIARGWTLWRVRDGRALVEAGGAYYVVVPGSTLPRLGKVQQIIRRDGRWVVQTPNGLIVQRG